MQQGGTGPAPGGYPAQPGYAQPENEPNSVTALVLGILGIVVCGVVAPFAWNLGKKSLDNIRSNPGRYSGEGMAQAGYILGIIGTILLILAVIFLIVYFIFVAAMIGSM